MKRINFPPQEKVFNLLLTERICPLIIKLFSPSTKYRHSPPANALSPSDKPTFALSVRLLRILSVLIREFYTSLVSEVYAHVFIIISLSLSLSDHTVRDILINVSTILRQ